MLGPTGLKRKKRKKKTGSDLGTVLLTYVCYIFVVLVSGVVYSGLKL